MPPTGDLDELRKLFEERLAEQQEEHHGGNKWIGTGGTSPVGHSGHYPGGMRVGGVSRNKSAVKVAMESDPATRPFAVLLGGDGGSGPGDSPEAPPVAEPAAEADMRRGV